MAPSMWQQTEEMAKKHDQGGSLWLKLGNDGDKAVVVFLGEPHPREVCFVDGKYMPFDEKLKAQGTQALAARGAQRRALRLEGGEGPRAGRHVLQGPRPRPREVRPREVGLRDPAPRRRQGSEDDLLHPPEHQLSAEQQKAFQALPQHDLEKLYAGESEGGGSAPLGSYDQKADGTVDPKVAQAIATQLKALPREAVDRFLQKFGVQRIKDLPAAQVEKARAFVEQLQTELAAPAATETEVDPFA
jgi:hypothetical protein